MPTILPDHVELSRRAFITAACGAIGLGYFSFESRELRATISHALKARDAVHPAGWRFLTPDQAVAVAAVASQIIPTDDTPGAREAGVVFFIDHALATWAAPAGPLITSGIDRLNKPASFADLPDTAQVQALKAVEQTAFFQVIRFYTIAGMFSLPSYGGNQDTVGWRLIGLENRHAWQPPFGFYDAAAAGPNP